MSFNCGNVFINDWTQLLPEGGGDFDIIAIGLQESLFKVKKKKKKDKKKKKSSSDENKEEEEDSCMVEWFDSCPSLSLAFFLFTFSLICILLSFVRCF